MKIIKKKKKEDGVEKLDYLKIIISFKVEIYNIIMNIFILFK